MRSLIHLIAIVLAVVLLTGMPSVGTAPVVTGLVVILVIWLASHFWLLRRKSKR